MPAEGREHAGLRTLSVPESPHHECHASSFEVEVLGSSQQVALPPSSKRHMHQVPVQLFTAKRFPWESIRKYPGQAAGRPGCPSCSARLSGRSRKKCNSRSFCSGLLQTACVDMAHTFHKSGPLISLCNPHTPEIEWISLRQKTPIVIPAACLGYQSAQDAHGRSLAPAQ